MASKLEDVLNEDLINLVEECNKIVKDEISRISLRDLSYGRKMMGILLKQKTADKIRNKNEKRGIVYPAAVVVEKQNSSMNIDIQLWNEIISGCRDAGVSVMAFADDNIVNYKKILKIFLETPEIIFPIMVKGSMLDEELVDYFYNARNVVPIIKVEDLKKGLDLNSLKKRNILYVLYIKVNGQNFQEALNSRLIKYYYDSGCRAFVFMEDNNSLNKSEQDILETTVKFFKEKYKGIFIDFPGDKKIYDGCLKEGVGFAYINAKRELVYGEELDSSNIVSGLLNTTLRDVTEIQNIFI